MSVINWESDIDKACLRARGEDRFILLDFFSPT